MLINRAYKVEIDPNNTQKTFLNKSIGIARLAYNWGLNQCIENYKQGNKYKGAIDLHKQLCAIKSTEFPFMYGVSKSAPQNALRDLDIAFKNFFKGLKKKQKVGFPKFKSKRNNKQTFRIDGLNIRVEGNRIKLPKIGWIRLKEANYIPVANVKYLNATISKELDKYFVSVAVQEETSVSNKQVEEIIGIDLGIKTLATCSNGEIYPNPKFTNKYASKLKSEQRRLSRKQKGSNNRIKQRLKVAKVHRKIKNSRLDALHKTTSSITKTKCRIIVLEDLNVKGMMKNHKLAKAIADSSFYELKRQTTYKTLFYGGEIHLINRFFPSSKTCSNCGAVKEELKLSERIYNCTDCGFSLDRDLNAAINIERFYTGSSSEINAFGENVSLGSSLLEHSNLVELGIKQDS